MNNNTFIREISETQSKYKLVKKNVTQQSSYNLSVELENYLYDNGAIKKTTISGRENDNNIYYVLNDGVRIHFGQGLINVIGEEYSNIDANIILVHTTNNNKFQIRRNDHNVASASLNWYKELYDKNFEGANFIISYDASNKILNIDNKISPSDIISKVGPSDDANVDDYILLFKSYYLNNLYKFKDEVEKQKDMCNKFIEENPLDSIKDINIDEYVLGDGKKSGFCYDLEYGVYKLAGPSIGGPTSNKFGFYVHNGQYIRNKDIIEKPEEFWKDLRNQLYSFLKEYENLNEPIRAAEKYPLLKGMSMVLTKLLCIYYPNKFISISPSSNLTLLLRYFGYNFDKKMEVDELSFALNENIRNDIPEINDHDSRYIGIALLHFLKDTVESEQEEVEDIDEIIEDYKKEDFLSEVFMNEKEYNTLENLLTHKKNIILQGSPGVGKTFMAKRLAYSIIGRKSKNQLLSVQFHQSYSYEDFIEGIRPNEDGNFRLEDGVFKEFVERAKKDREREYFVIIDEINRGNLSKILGELMKLIESDKRDVEDAILPYSKKEFVVPSNLYIIGTMNTADRSLAMVDYALRRRFAFYHVKPAFNKEEFKNYLRDINKISEININELCTKLNKLNGAINNDLGKGFEVGHSYFVDSLKVDDFSNSYNEIVEYEIKPLLEEYWFDDENKVDEYKNML